MYCRPPTAGAKFDSGWEESFLSSSCPFPASPRAPKARPPLRATGAFGTTPPHVTPSCCELLPSRSGAVNGKRLHYSAVEQFDVDTAVNRRRFQAVFQFFLCTVSFE